MKGQMRAVVIVAPDQVEIQDVEIPEIGPDEVLIQVKACAVCGSDPMLVHGTYPIARYPLIPGHEVGGVVMGMGSEVINFREGDRVTLESHRGCGKCVNCMRGLYTNCLNYGNLEAGHKQIGFTVDGGFAEYLAVSERCVHALPPNVEFHEAPVAQAVAVALYGLRQAGGFFPSETTVILGPGLLGLVTVQLARASSSGPVFLAGTNAQRLALGGQMGAVETFHVREVDLVSAVMERTGGLGADLVIEASGAAESVSQAVDMCRPGGRIVLFGVAKEPATVSSTKIALGNLRIYGSRGEGMWAMKDALGIMAQGRIESDRLVTHRFPLEQFMKALETMEKRIDGAIRVVVEPD